VTDAQDLDNLTACHDCDLLIERIELDETQQAHCPRCNSLMYRGRRDMNNKTLIISFSGLLMVIPAYYFPMMSMEAIGIEHSTSLLQSIPPMMNSNFWLIGAGLILFAVIIPVLILLLAFSISIHLQLKVLPRYLITLQKYYQELVSWGMSEVYILGLIVSFVKLVDDFTMSVNIGLISFSIMMFCSLMVTTTASKRNFWETMHEK